jgi:hypothetical protein
MKPFLRLLLVSTALLASGALQVAAAAGEDACCAEERNPEEPGVPCPDCPPGLACGCCPVRGVQQPTAPVVAPAAAAGAVALAVVREPSGAGAADDIFHPPRR